MIDRICCRRSSKNWGNLESREPVEKSPASYSPQKKSLQLQKGNKFGAGFEKYWECTFCPFRMTLLFLNIRLTHVSLHRFVSRVQDGALMRFFFNSVLFLFIFSSSVFATTWRFGENVFLSWSGLLLSYVSVKLRVWRKVSIRYIYSGFARCCFAFFASFAGPFVSPNL